MKTNHKHYSVGAVIWIVIKYFSLVFFSFVALLPIVSCVITAFKTDAEYQSTNVMTLPESWLNFSNFTDAFTRANMGRAYMNSAIILVFVLLGSILVGTQLAYVLNRFKFPGNGLIRSLFLFATLLPGIAMQVSVYQIMSNLKTYTYPRLPLRCESVPSQSNERRNPRPSRYHEPTHEYRYLCYIPPVSL